MKLHASAALRLKKRTLLVLRVVEEGRSLAEAAEAAEVSERTAGKWVRSRLAEGDADLDGCVILEFEGELSGDRDLDADAGALLVKPARIVGRHEIDRDRAG